MSSGQSTAELQKTWTLLADYIKHMSILVFLDIYEPTTVQQATNTDEIRIYDVLQQEFLICANDRMFEDAVFLLIRKRQ